MYTSCKIPLCEIFSSIQLLSLYFTQTFFWALSYMKPPCVPKNLSHRFVTAMCWTVRLILFGVDHVYSVAVTCQCSCKQQNLCVFLNNIVLFSLQNVKYFTWKLQKSILTYHSDVIFTEDESLNFESMWAINLYLSWRV